MRVSVSCSSATTTPSGQTLRRTSNRVSNPATSNRVQPRNSFDAQSVRNSSSLNATDSPRFAAVSSRNPIFIRFAIIRQQ